MTHFIRYFCLLLFVMSFSVSSFADYASYQDLRDLDSSTLTDGDVLTVTNYGISGDFVVDTGTVTDDDATLIVFDDDSGRYCERIITGNIQASWFGVVADSSGLATPDGTDNKDTLQDFFDYMRGRSGVFELPTDGTLYIYTSEGLDMTVNGATEDYYSPVLLGNNKVITMRGSGVTTGQVLKVGALSSSDIPGGQKIVIRDLEIHGPMMGDTNWKPRDYQAGNPTSTTDGIYLENWRNIELQNVIVTGCYRGFRNKFVFPITELNCRAESCYVGWFIEGDVTSRSSLRCRSLNNRWGVIIEPDTATKEVYGQVFDGLHLEGCLMGVVLNPRSGTGVGIHDISFQNVYIEELGYVVNGTRKTDVFRVGKSYDIADVTDAGTNQTRSIFNFKFSPWVETYTEAVPSLGGVQAVFGTAGDIKGVELSNTILMPNDIAGYDSVESIGWYPSWLQDASTRDFTHYPGESMFSLKINNADANGSITPSFSTGGVTISKTANGVYTITLPYANATKLHYLLITTVDRASYVTADPKTSNTWELRAYDTSWTLAGAEPRVFCLIKQPH